jgi:MFS family permease
MSSSSKSNQVTFLASKKLYIAWFMASVFYLYQYALRVSPGMMIEYIRLDFYVKAEEFAFLGSLYLLFYSILQIPVGIIVDKFCVKKTLLVSILLCILGSYISSITTNFTVMQISRVIIAIGSASSFMIPLKIIADNFSPGKRGLLMGMTLTLGTVGALVADRAITYCSNNYNWRYVWEAFAVAGVLIFILSILLIPSTKRKKYQNVKIDKERDLLGEIVYILRDKNIMLYSILAIGIYTPLSVVSDLWGVAFLSAKLDLERDVASHLSVVLYLGLAIGAIIIPWIFEKLHLLNLGIRWCTFAILCCFLILIYVSYPSLSFVFYLFTITGILCGSEMLCFTGALRYTSSRNSGEVIGVVNTCNMLGGAFLQQFIGSALDSNWNGVVDKNGLRVYSNADFTNALLCIPILLFCCFLLSLLLDKKQ